MIPQGAVHRQAGLPQWGHQADEGGVVSRLAVQKRAVAVDEHPVGFVGQLQRLVHAAGQVVPHDHATRLGLRIRRDVGI